MTDAIPRTFIADEPAVRAAFNGDELYAQKSAINEEVGDLEQMDYWNVVQPPKGEQVMHTKFVLKRKRDENGTICKHKARSIVCEKEEESCQKKSFLPVVHPNVTSSILSLSVQKGWASKHTDFENTFPNGILERTVYSEIPSHLFTDR